MVLLRLSPSSEEADGSAFVGRRALVVAMPRRHLAATDAA